ncbi:hypothetical protein K402DRAFT_374176 [Aulographum hederae CBS 113979]|uniref:Zn(2)-C6 fungal-type domain-containing protein n=1 Tax=Aulographum hederae CBS 113979 TaxID=1176131 RepID=A0A6G1H5T4_9PEZI|nr:hypothetical protein K402DRAFT_374176 [Aulographum hederae CBS 113979]
MMRKSHKKARTGCINCKQRKVKCDEQRPSCANCVRRSTLCVYSSHNGSPSAESPDSLGVLPNGTFAIPRNPQDYTPHSLHMLDLELLHNFTVSTCYTLSHNAVSKDVWRVEVPKLAFSNEFVMRGILAFSSLHLSYSRKDKSDFFLQYANRTHDLALREATILLSNINKDNCCALYTFSALSCMYAMSAPKNMEDLISVGQTGLEEWFILFRGTRAIIESSIDTLIAGPMAPVFRLGLRRQELRGISEPQTHYLDNLRETVLDPCDDPATKAIYTNIVDELERTFAVVEAFNTPAPESSDIFIWIWMLSEEYIQLLRERTPEALAILAHYCILLKKLDGWWWMESFNKRLIRLIYYSLHQEHRQWIRYPIEEIGWVPD